LRCVLIVKKEIEASHNQSLTDEVCQEVTRVWFLRQRSMKIEGHMSGNVHLHNLKITATALTSTTKVVVSNKATRIKEIEEE
jgi:hypothetical protein